MSRGFGIFRCLDLGAGGGRVLIYGTGSDLSRGLDIFRSLGFGVRGGRVLINGNRVLRTTFFLDLRRASR
jgi:hypothetical protein